MVSVNKFVAKIVPYKLVHSLDKMSKSQDVFKLDWNESTITPPKKVIKAIKHFLSHKGHVNWYADPSQKSLKEKIAKYANVKFNEILITNGSDQAHELICNTYLEEGNQVLVPIPTYTNFLIWPKIRGAKIIEMPYEINSENNVENIFNKINSKTKIVYLVNPYICVYSIKEITRLAKAKKNSLFLIDEAYYEFYGKSCTNLINKFDNIIITRSFSKALSIAGLRLGYIIANNKIIENLSKIHNFKSVNVLAQIAGEAILKDLRFVKHYVKEVNNAINLINIELPKMNFEVIPTHSGFVLFKHKTITKKKLIKVLEKNNIFVRDITKINSNQHYCRMNVGTVFQTRKLIKLMKKLFL